jgi:hypothetical protein
MQTDHSPAYLRQSPIADERAQRLDVAYLRTLDADRLLAPYRTEAGLEPEGGIPGARAVANLTIADMVALAAYLSSLEP